MATLPVVYASRPDCITEAENPRSYVELLLKIFPSEVLDDVTRLTGKQAAEVVDGMEGVIVVVP